MLLAVVVGLTLLSAVSSETIAFSVGIDYHTTIEKGNILIYNQQFINAGAGYNLQSGVFTAPKSGRYIFHINCETQAEGECYIALYKNDDLMVTAYAYEWHLTYYHTYDSADFRKNKTKASYNFPQRKVFESLIFVCEIVHDSRPYIVTRKIDALTNNVILPLEKGDRVYVKAVRDTYLYGTKDDVYATFAGHLIGQ